MSQMKKFLLEIQPKINVTFTHISEYDILSETNLIYTTIAWWIDHILIKKAIKKIEHLGLGNSWEHIRGVKSLKLSAIKNVISFKPQNLPRY